MGLSSRAKADKLSAVMVSVCHGGQMGDADHSSAALLSRSLPGFGDKAVGE